MVEIFPLLGGVIGAVARVVVDCVATPIKNQLNYLCCFNSNIEELGVEVESLEPKRAGLQQQVDAAKRNVEVVLPDVEDWLQKVNEIKKTNDRIHQARDEIRKRCLHGCCTMLLSRYSLSREANKKAKASIELRNSGNFPTISTPVCPTELELPAISEIEFESRKVREEEIMNALKDKNVHMIGICGMGGVGKTTMVNKIVKRVREERLFEKVVRAVVTQELNLKRIQQEIAEDLGLELKQETVSVRAKLIHTRLNDAKGSVLIILDDIWKNLKLEEIGIPSLSTNVGCKIILTSRVHDVCIQMKAEKIFPLVELPEEEAWRLFREHAGPTADAPNLRQVAESVAKECKGLPLALVTVGRALSGQSKTFWEDALLQLQQSTPANIPEVLDGVYQPLMLSYNHLGNVETKYLFLLCCFYPEDHDISLGDLVGYGTGLQVFSGVRTLREARNRVRALVETLKHRFLLENGKDEEHVKLHDVVRDLAIIIASTKDRHVFMTSNEIDLEEWPNKASYDEPTTIPVGLPERIDYTNLQTLRLEIDVEFKGEIYMPNKFFYGMTGLKVLHIEGINVLLRLPQSLQFLSNLQTLHLHSCDCTGSIHLIGNLVNLGILSLRSSLIEVLPKEIENLKKLKLLDLTGCAKLEKIAPGVISGLVALEELLMLDSFKKWEAEVEGQERKYASLVEVASLKKLTTLELEIPDPEILPHDACQWQEFRRYVITIGMSNSYDTRLVSGDYDKVLKLKLYKPVRLSNWIHILLREAKYLDLNLRGSDASAKILELVQKGSQTLKKLQLEDFDGYWENIFPSCSCADVVFPALEELYLSNFRDLKVIFRALLLAGSFNALEQLRLENLLKLTHLWSENLCLPNLKKVFIRNCCSLEYVFLLSTAVSLSQIQQLEIENCLILGEVLKTETGDMIAREDAEEAQVMVKETLFPRLKDVLLSNLPNFRNFCRRNNDIEFPSLESLTIKDCPKMEKFSLGSVSLPSLEFVVGLFNPNFATQMLFNKEEGERSRVPPFLCKQEPQNEVRLKNDDFKLSARDLSIIWGEDTRYWEWGLAKYSSGNFVVGAKLLEVWWFDIRGRFDVTKLSPRTLYQVVFDIKLEKFNFKFDTPVNLILAPSDGFTQERKENLEHKPRGEWIEVLAGEFTTGLDPAGGLEFALFQHDTKIEKRGLLIKGVTIRPKA